MPGRFEVRDGVIFDGAHNPAGMAALAEALGDRRVVAVLCVLDDKDAAEMLRALLPLCDEVVCTRCANPRALPPGTLRVAGRPSSAAARRSSPTRAAALARARDAAADGRDAARHRLDLPARRPAAPGGRAEGVDAVNEDGPGVGALIAVVAITVALVILVFFAVGYGIGRAFL